MGLAYWDESDVLGRKLKLEVGGSDRDKITEGEEPTVENLCAYPPTFSR